MIHSGTLKLYTKGWDDIRNEKNFGVDQVEQKIIEKQISDLEKERMLSDVMVENVLSMNKTSTKILNPFDRNEDKMNDLKSGPRQAKGESTISKLCLAEYND